MMEEDPIKCWWYRIKLKQIAAKPSGISGTLVNTNNVEGDGVGIHVLLLWPQT